MKRIGVFTSGGDAPGMNAAVRAVVRTATKKGLDVTGIMRGYQGMIEGDFRDLGHHSVSNILQTGGTILKTARSEDFRTAGGREKAVRNLRDNHIDALVAIGGDGTFRGASEIIEEHDMVVAGVPATIDNDLYGTDETIGYETAMNTAMWAIDKIRDTADSHERLFLIEVMGRHAGFIALDTGISCGAELILLPESQTRMEDIREALRNALKVQRRGTLVIVAEGSETGGALTLAEKLKDEFGQYDMRVSILGHIQRGGSPTAHDRVLASRLGSAAVKALTEGRNNVMAGVVNNATTFTPLSETWSIKKSLNTELLELAKVLT